MDRFDWDQAIAEEKRTTLLEMCANGQDDDLAPEERPDRAEVAPGCLLKPYDDVIVSGMPVRVLCPGRGIGWFYALQFDDPIFFWGLFQAVHVTDRAPFDPEETPMPIFEAAP